MSSTDNSGTRSTSSSSSSPLLPRRTSAAAAAGAASSSSSSRGSPPPGSPAGGPTTPPPSSASLSSSPSPSRLSGRRKLSLTPPPLTPHRHSHPPHHDMRRLPTSLPLHHHHDNSGSSSSSSSGTARVGRAAVLGAFVMLLVHQTQLAYVHHSTHHAMFHFDLLRHGNDVVASSLLSTTSPATTSATTSTTTTTTTTTTAATPPASATLPRQDDSSATRDGGGSETWGDYLYSLFHPAAEHEDQRHEEFAPLPAVLAAGGGTSRGDRARRSRGRSVSGYGDPIHLGGRVDYPAVQSVSPRVFRLVRSGWGARSLVDVGCGRGWSALWFYLQGVRTRCVEASPSALNRTVLPAPALVNHDYTRGPWGPSDTVDVAWCTAFVQQVPKSSMRNYVATLRRAAVVVASFPGEAGGEGGAWHSVEVHSAEWWTVQFERYGFVRNHELTRQVREAARADATELGPDRRPYRTRDLADDAVVFLNPRVAALDGHDHLFPEVGCVGGGGAGAGGNGTTAARRECGRGRGEATEMALDDAYLPPPIVTDKSEMWLDLVRRNLLGEHVVPDDVLPPPAAKAASAASASSDPKAAVGVGATPNDWVGVGVAAAAAADLSRHAIRTIPQRVEAGDASVPLPKVPVVVWPMWEYRDQPKVTTADAIHIEKNGVEESPVLDMKHDIFNFDENVVWVGNTGYAHGWNLWCDKFMEHVASAQERRKQLGLGTSWPIYIVDFTDYATRQRCRGIEQAVGPEYVTYSKRSMAKHRMWNGTKGWVEEGIRLPDETPGTGIVYRHAPLAVRTDTVLHLQQTLKARNLTIRDKIEALERPVDAMHLWPLDANTSKTVGTVQSNLRSTVSRVVDEVGASSGLNVYVGLAGDTSVAGRRGVTSSYIEALLSTKILVVSQRDQWEDHYRLFEALVVGPLVMTDRMLGMPVGLANGTSIIEYSSEDELKSLILYYATNHEERIAIAAEGRRVAMSRHRSWHRMEEILFGRPLSTCELAASTHPGSACPYVVHANETFASPAAETASLR